MSRRVRGRRIEPPHGPRAPERTGVRTGASRGAPRRRRRSKVPQAFRILALERITQAVAPHDERGRVVVAALRLERNTRADLLAAHRATRSDVTADAEADDRFVVAAPPGPAAGRAETYAFAWLQRRTGDSDALAHQSFAVDVRQRHAWCWAITSACSRSRFVRRLRSNPARGRGAGAGVARDRWVRHHERQQLRRVPPRSSAGAADGTWSTGPALVRVGRRRRCRDVPAFPTHVCGGDAGGVEVMTPPRRRRRVSMRPPRRAPHPRGPARAEAFSGKGGVARAGFGDPEIAAPFPSREPKVLVGNSPRTSLRAWSERFSSRTATAWTSGRPRGAQRDVRRGLRPRATQAETRSRQAPRPALVPPPARQPRRPPLGCTASICTPRARRPGRAPMKATADVGPAMGARSWRASRADAPAAPASPRRASELRSFHAAAVSRRTPPPDLSGPAGSCDTWTPSRVFPNFETSSRRRCRRPAVHPRERTRRVRRGVPMIVAYSPPPKRERSARSSTSRADTDSSGCWRGSHRSGD